MTVGLYITSRVVNERDIGIWWRTDTGKKYKVYQYRPFFYVPSKLGVYRSVLVKRWIGFTSTLPLM